MAKGKGSSGKESSGKSIQGSLPGSRLGGIGGYRAGGYSSTGSDSAYKSFGYGKLSHGVGNTAYSGLSKLLGSFPISLPTSYSAGSMREVPGEFLTLEELERRKRKYIKKEEPLNHYQKRMQLALRQKAGYRNDYSLLSPNSTLPDRAPIRMY